MVSFGLSSLRGTRFLSWGGPDPSRASRFDGGVRKPGFEPPLGDHVFMGVRKHGLEHFFRALGHGKHRPMNRHALGFGSSKLRGFCCVFIIMRMIGMI